MFVPAPPAQLALAQAPVGALSSALPLATPPIERSASTTLSVRRSSLDVLDGHQATVSGTLLGDHRSVGLPGRMVTLQALGRHGWSTIAHTHTAISGRFQLRYVPWRTGSEQVRVRFAGDATGLGARRRLGRLNVYRLAEVSWYGGGGSLACGGSLTGATLGVANKTLPCGTLVMLRYGGRSIQVPVVDRGPYVAGREFDLTQATKEALGFGDTGQVWSTR